MYKGVLVGPTPGLSGCPGGLTVDPPNPGPTMAVAGSRGSSTDASKLLSAPTLTSHAPRLTCRRKGPFTVLHPERVVGAPLHSTGTSSYFIISCRSMAIVFMSSVFP